jgi:hypothetical protein
MNAFQSVDDSGLAPRWARVVLRENYLNMKLSTQVVQVGDVNVVRIAR